VLAINGGPPVVPADAVAPWPDITDDDERAVVRALRSASPWRWPNPTVQGLEHAWSIHTTMPYTLAANSGTAALHMAVAACEVEPGDEVIVPADTFLASASCVLHHNAIPIFADVDPRTYNIDPTSVEEQITDRTRAVVAVDLHGLPAEYDALRKICKRHGLPLIEDGSQAQGARYKGIPVGALGDVSGCSDNGLKPLSALSEGGLFATHDERRWRLAARLRMFGEDEGRDIYGDREYDALIMGWMYRMALLEAAFATSQLARLPEMTRQRIANGKHLTERLTGLPGIRTPFVPADTTHVYFFYPILVEPETLDMSDVPVWAFRLGLREALQAEGVTISRWQRRPLPAQTLFVQQRGYGRGCPWTCGHARPGIVYRETDYPNAAYVCERRLVLGKYTSPLGPPNGLELMDLIADAFFKVLVTHVGDLGTLVRDLARTSQR
jgi:perosamine synthetase